MLQLTNLNLPKEAQNRLNGLQNKVNDETTFQERANKAWDLWNTKSNSGVGARTFETIKTTLTAMCVGDGLCNYCEHNEASDIEHILPKSLFPAQAFIWENYILACKHCNTTYKLDKIDIFNPVNTHQAERVERGTEPATQDIAFIQLRLENPLDFLELSLNDFMFYAKAQPNTREFAKADRTLDILQLDDRLIGYRKSAFKNYATRFEEIIMVGKATTFEEIERVTFGQPIFDKTLPFIDAKKKILEAMKADFKVQAHPTVWREMIRQKDNLHIDLQKLFDENSSLLVEL